MAVQLKQFIKQLEESGVITAEVLREFLPPIAAPQDAEELAKALIRQKKLTKFQAEQISKGKGKSLVLGNYVLLDKIGAGGMGQVFKALHRRMDRLVAVKLLPTAMTKDKTAIARFEREVKAAGRLRHSNIVAADDADEANGLHFLVMEYIEGSDLSALVKGNGPLSVSQAVDVILQAAIGLEFAHHEGVIHRDIKPSNLLLDKRGTVKILDMGLARLRTEADAPAQTELTSTGTVMGTVDFMPPEQALDSKMADARADIYALGCSLYYLITAKATYEGDSMLQKLLAHREDPIPSLGVGRNDIPKSLDGVFKKMVAKRVDDRYQTMTELIPDLKHCQTELGPTLSTDIKSSGTNSRPPSSASINSRRPSAISVQAKTKAATLAASTAASEVTILKSGTTQETDPETRVLPRPNQRKQNGQPISAVASAWLTNRRVQIGSAVLGGLLLVLLAVVLIQTPTGTLRVEVFDPDVEVKLIGTTITFKHSNSEPVHVKIGEKKLQITRGDLSLETEAFTLKNGMEMVVKVEFFDDKLLASSDGRTLGEKSASRQMGASASSAVALQSTSEKWTDLFDGKSLTGWSGDVNVMSIEDGVLVNSGQRGTVVCPGDYADVEFEIEYRLAANGNSGLCFGFDGTGDPSTNGLEIQMLDDDTYPNTPEQASCGSLWSVIGPKSHVFKRWPTWNQLRVISTTKRIFIEQNSTVMVDASRSQLLRDVPQHEGLSHTSGKIALFPLTARSEYRNFRIRPYKKPSWETAEFKMWADQVSAMALDAQVKAVKSKLREWNPGFYGPVEFKSENGQVTEIKLAADQIEYLAPVRALTRLTALDCSGSAPGKGILSDLSPLKGMRLLSLRILNTCVANLEPLANMPLKNLACISTLVTDLSPLRGMPLLNLDLDQTSVADLSPLKGSSLKYLWLLGTKVTDLSPLAGLQLIEIGFRYTQVSDLSPLKGQPIVYLEMSNSRVTDKSPLRELMLEKLVCDLDPERDIEILRSIKSLMRINVQQAADVLNNLEAERSKNK